MNIMGENTDKNPLNSKNPSSVSAITQERATKSNAIEIPSISLPKGGGALKGIDEKFQVNSANGTAGYSIPLPVSPGRDGFSPSLAQSYNSGSGNSVFGLGWSLGIPSIQQKTDKKLSQYMGNTDEDTFMFSDAEDIVSFLDYKNGWEPMEAELDGFTIKRYGPRLEGEFSKTEKIKNSEGEVYWKVTSQNNTVTYFGLKADLRIVNPEDAYRIIQLLPCFSYDNKGDLIKYIYKKEDNENVPDMLMKDANWQNQTVLQWLSNSLTAH